MKYNQILEIITICFLLMVSCGKSPICWGDDKDKGLIEQSISMKDIPHSMRYYVEEKNHLIVRDTFDLLSAFDSIYTFRIDTFSYTRSDYDIDKLELREFYREFNFDTHSILGFWATGGCETDFIREVLKDEDNKKYIYTIKVKECGWCMSLRVDANMVLMPKIEDNYKVEFELTD